MVIVALEHVRQCYSARDGEAIHDVLKAAFAGSERVILSFKGVSDVPSSFVNAALVPFLQAHGDDWIKAHLTIVGATKQVADMIRRCFNVARRAPTAA